MAGKENTDDTETFIKIASGDTNTLRSSENVNFTGLSKDEVLKYATDPTWVKIRWIIFGTFWLLWALMLLAAVLLIVFQPKCPFRPRLDWYQTETFYQIDIAKFQDSNGDGVGDLEGVSNQLDYLKGLGVKTILLYNAVDFKQPKALNSMYGDEALLTQFRKVLRAKSMHLVVDIPIDALGTTEIELKTAVSTVTHWLNKNADGVRISSMEKLKELQFSKSGSIDAVLSGLRASVDEISKRTLNKKLLMFTSNNYDFNLKLAFFSPHLVVSHLFNSTDLTNTLTSPRKIIDAVNQTQFEFKDSPRSTMLSWDENPRLGSVQEGHTVAHVLLLLLDSTPITLYGDELGLTAVNRSQGHMQWTNTVGCGFTSNATAAVRINPRGGCQSNVQKHTAHGAGDTLIDLFAHLVTLRENESFQFGKNKLIDEDRIFSFVRHAEGFPAYLVLVHFNSDAKEPHLLNYHKEHSIAQNAVVEYYFGPARHTDFAVGKKVSTDKILLSYGDILILVLQP